MTDSYITLSGTSKEEVLINKSRFIGYAAPCNDENSALAFLQRVKDEHKTATHHCFAYIIGENSGIMRYSDDGEPGGTAGMPIMDVMRKKAIVNSCVVVVRYFGGVLLGTGGLVRAYTQSAQLALESAGLAKMERTAVFSCELPYSVWDKFRYAAERLPLRIENVSFGTSVSFHLYCRCSDLDHYFSRITEVSERKLNSAFLEERYSAWTIQ